MCGDAAVMVLMLLREHLAMWAGMSMRTCVNVQRQLRLKGYWNAALTLPRSFLADALMCIDVY